MNQTIQQESDVVLQKERSFNSHKKAFFLDKFLNILEDGFLGYSMKITENEENIGLEKAKICVS